LEIVPGSEKAALAAAGNDPAVRALRGLQCSHGKAQRLAPQAQQLLETLNDRASEVQVTLARVNDLLNDTNRAKPVRGRWPRTRGMIAENRGAVKAAVQNLNSASQKLEPLLEDLPKNFRAGR